MTKHIRQEELDNLYQAILELKDLEDCKKFFQDLCTVGELRAMEQRFEVAILLSEGMIYNDILERTGASSSAVRLPVPQARSRTVCTGFFRRAKCFSMYLHHRG